MSYKLVNANALVISYPEVNINSFPCIFADLPEGLNGGHYTIEEDTISRNAVKEWYCNATCGKKPWNCKLTEPCDDCKAIDNIPAAGFSTPPEVDIDLIRDEIELMIDNGDWGDSTLLALRMVLKMIDRKDEEK